MPYRFKTDEPLDKGFRRIMAEQVARVAKTHADGRDPALAVHETRKCIKRMRALVRLFRFILGEDTFKSLNAQLRDIAALLSEARDTQVMLDTVTRLQEESPAKAAGAFESVKAALIERMSMSKEAGAKTGDTAEVTARLQKFGKGIARLKIADATIDGVVRGLEVSYRNGRKAFGTAFRSESDENFHEWRKLVQQQWRQMNLVSAAWPDYYGARVSVARELAQMLGDDHDLAMLVEFVGSNEPPAVQPTEAGKLIALITERQAALRVSSRFLGTRLYAEGASGLARRTVTYWHAACALSKPVAPAKRKT